MRINEVVLTEGPIDWLSRKGFFGKQSAADAWGRKLASDAAVRGEEQQATAYATNLRNYLMNAENSGKLVIKGPGVTSVPVNQSIEHWLKQYFDDALSEWKPPAGWDLNQEIAQFASEYKGGGQLPPAAGKIWSAIQAIRPIAGPTSSAVKAASQAGPGGSRITGAAPPNSNISRNNPWASGDPANNQNVVYSYDKRTQTWTQYVKNTMPARGRVPASIRAGRQIATIDPSNPNWQKLNDMYATEIGRL